MVSQKWLTIVLVSVLLNAVGAGILWWQGQQMLDTYASIREQKDALEASEGGAANGHSGKNIIIRDVANPELDRQPQHFHLFIYFFLRGPETRQCRIWAASAHVRVKERRQEGVQSKMRTEAMLRANS